MFVQAGNLYLERTSIHKYDYFAISLQMYTGVIHAVSEMYKENGIRTFYKGEMYTW